MICYEETMVDRIDIVNPHLVSRSYDRSHNNENMARALEALHTCWQAYARSDNPLTLEGANASFSSISNLLEKERSSLKEETVASLKAYLEGFPRQYPNEDAYLRALQAVKEDVI